MHKEITYEVWQDDMCVAASDSRADAHHYLMMYAQDGPASLFKVSTTRKFIAEVELTKHEE